jgi:hypothetical protein
LLHRLLDRTGSSTTDVLERDHVEALRKLLVDETVCGSERAVLMELPEMKVRAGQEK